MISDSQFLEPFQQLIPQCPNRLVGTIRLLHKRDDGTIGITAHERTPLDSTNTVWFIQSDLLARALLAVHH